MWNKANSAIPSNSRAVLVKCSGSDRRAPDFYAVSCYKDGMWNQQHEDNRLGFHVKAWHEIPRETK